MKFNVLLAIACLAIGASAAWYLKPDSASGTASTEDSDSKPTPSSRKPGSPENSSRKKGDKTVVKSTRTNNGDNKPAIVASVGSEEMSNQMASMFKKRQMAKLDARIAKLVAQLNLTKDQEEALRKAAEEKLGGFEGLFNGDFDPSKMRSMFKSDGLDEALADILTPEQKEEHEALKKRELANKIEARALKELAKLSDLDLTQDQKDAAYDVLYKQAEESVGNEAPAQGVISMITDGFGIEIDGDAVGIATAVIPSDGEAASGEGEQNPQDYMKRAQERMQKQIDDKVEAMRPVLDDSQLEQYRKGLELKQGGFFGGFLNGAEAGGSTTGGK